MSAVDLSPLLRKALRLARLDFETVLEKARAGEVQFHEVKGAVGLTSISVSGPYRTCYCLAVAGERSGLSELERTIERFARESHCQAIEADGRPGWVRLHRSLADGYKPTAVKFRKTLEY